MSHSLRYLWIGCCCAAVRAEDPAALDAFESRVRPVLVERCYPCHSVRAPKVRGELRLDSREGVLRGGSRGPAIVPGDAARSLLIRAVRRADPELAMPPDGPLPASEVEALAVWVAAGAPDPRVGPAPPPATATRTGDHWAFLPPREPPLPAVRDSSWPRGATDAFLLATLEGSELAPAPEADRRTHIRRLAHDLTGLAPGPAEVEDFAADGSPDAYERLVDRILASPTYGERWARHWLDLARYADTKGYVYDREEKRFVHAHVYRDWVVRALNEDLPYDRFLLLQIAGDELAAADPATGDRPDLAAMGFLTVGRRFLGVVHDIIDDRIDTLFRATQGLTLGCARCHDHKFDPISMRDYYGLYGVFHGSAERTVPLRSHAARTPEGEAYAAELAKREEALRSTFEKKKAELAARLRARVADYLAQVLDVEKLPTEEFYAILGPEDLNPVVVRRWQSFIFEAGRRRDPVFGIWASLASLPEKDFVPLAPRRIERLAGLETGAANPLVARELRAAPLASMRDVAARYGQLLARIEAEWTQALAAAAAAGKSAPARLDEPAAEELRQVLHGPDTPASVPPGPIVDVEWFFDEGTRVDLAKKQAAIDAWHITAPGATPQAVILEDRPVQRDARIFLRGNPAQRGDEVPRKLIDVLAPPAASPFRHGSGRAELARAIASAENPLTARVIVNRVWSHLFGAGLVRTPSDFGRRSEPPTQPGLLDHLALELAADGWSVKRLVRRFVVSSAYRQASSAPRATLAADPENRLLGRMARRRLDLESLRDSLLEASGDLDLRLGGRPEDIVGQPFSRRRTIYGFLDRQFLPGLYRVFDFANPDQHTPERHATTVPQQALFLLNSPFLAERSRRLARRPEVATAADDDARIRALYRIVYQRPPTARELAVAARILLPAGSPPPRPRPPSLWRYGFSEVDPASGRLKSFTALPHFTGDAWQGGPAWPDSTLGWARLTAAGGHAGNDLAHAVVRRWVAPAALTVSVSGTIRHEHAEGEGIAAHLISSQGGTLGRWEVHHGEAEVARDGLRVEPGDTLDFVVDFRTALGWDDFTWAPVIRAVGGGEETVWDAAQQFAGPAEDEPLTPWEEYAQALLLANEFVFVD